MTSTDTHAGVATSEPGTLPGIVAGLGLGLVNVFAFATANRGLGVSSAFESTAAAAGRELAPEALRVNEYVAQRSDPPSLGWETWLVAGMAAGGLLSSLGRARTPQRTTPPLAAFLGGVLAMLGARMAEGCTSGHCLTGTAQRAASSWTFTPVMFASAVVTHRLLRGGAR